MMHVYPVYDKQNMSQYHQIMCTSQTVMSIKINQNLTQACFYALFMHLTVFFDENTNTFIFVI